MPSVALVQQSVQRVWFITGLYSHLSFSITLPILITGTSSGFGKALVSSVLARGDLVIATARSIEKIKSFYSLAGARASNLQLLRLDISESPEKIQRVIDHALSIWGRIDVVVNNAGIGMKSVLEEGGYVYLAYFTFSSSVSRTAPLPLSGHSPPCSNFKQTSSVF